MTPADRRGPDTTKAKRCNVILPGTGPLPILCRARRYKAGRCLEHYTEWRQQRALRGIQAQLLRDDKKPPRTFRVRPREKKPRTLVPNGQREDRAASRRQVRRSKRLDVAIAALPGYTRLVQKSMLGARGVVLSAAERRVIARAQRMAVPPAQLGQALLLCRKHRTSPEKLNAQAVRQLSRELSRELARSA